MWLPAIKGKKNKLPWLFAGVVCAVTLLLLRDIAAADRRQPNDRPKKTVDKRLTFEEHVAPILKAHCLKCHGRKVRKGGLDLRRRQTMLKGGESGPALLPGNPDKSLIIEMISSEQMPPEDEDRLDAQQIALLQRWVAAGAPIQGTKEPPLGETDEEFEVTDADREFWAFRHPVRPAVPRVKATEQVRTPLDAFLLAKLEDKGARFNPDALKHILIRRVYFDLLGLPPDPQAVEAFLEDQRMDAYERLVDRLLASPRYGERWGRHWLDIAGYADSDGYLEADRLRPEAWRYRDYVIRAHNDDKPFDRFVLEQIAGDELADWRRAKQITPELADNLIATGFLRTALDPTYAGYAEPLECYKVLADTVQIVSSAFLGLTIQCARCHSHRFDPISQKDYYRMHAIFLASYDPNRWLVSPERSIPLATESEQARVTKYNQQVEGRLKQLNGEIAALTSHFREKYLDERLSHITDEPLRSKVKAALLVDPKKRNAAQQKLVAERASGVTVAEKDVVARFPKFKTELDKFRRAVAAETALKKTIVRLRGLQDLDDKPAQAHLLIRGDFNKPGTAVQPAVPAVLVPQNYKFQPEPGYKLTGRRQALARWLVDPQNPLTARVHVNRIWAHHFGRGIVSTLDDFGNIGSRPSHPELLDWLAVELISTGWSQKSLHRLIVTSSVFRQTSQPNTQLKDADPENVLLGSWPPRRHEGEVVRDTILAVTGKLNRLMYGKPVPIKRHSDGQVTVAETSAGNRSSIYLMVRRSRPVTLLEMFDTPRMEINCPQRTESIVVTQSLTMLNSRFLEKNSQALAERLLKEAPNDDAARMDLAFRLLFARLPSGTERRMIATFLDDVVRVERGHRAGPISTDPVTTDETDAALQHRWSQLALVLLNSNEFLFVP